MGVGELRSHHIMLAMNPIEFEAIRNAAQGPMLEQDDD
jgi:hypothetical protein